MAAAAAGSRQRQGLWSRLRDVRLDPLESIGLPSKGDNRHGDLQLRVQEHELTDAQTFGLQDSGDVFC